VQLTAKAHPADWSQRKIKKKGEEGSVAPNAQLKGNIKREEEKRKALRCDETWGDLP